jgi:hypothetical protein
MPSAGKMSVSKDRRYDFWDNEEYFVAGKPYASLRKKSMRTEGEMPLCLILIENEDLNSNQQARTSVRLPLQPKKVLLREFRR